MPLERNSYGGGGLPIVFLLIQYTVIKETFYRLAIIGGLQPKNRAFKKQETTESMIEAIELIR